MTEYTTKIKLNFDNEILKFLKVKTNKEMIEKGVCHDENMYLKAQIAQDYKNSTYMYKDDLYKELKQIIN